MSLLDSLTLAYETLADDPIEVSIQYGKSILQAVSPLQKIMHNEPQRRAAIEPSSRRVQREVVTVDRNNYSDYIRRRPTVSATRVLVGAL
jgi:hypothetical protein